VYYTNASLERKERDKKINTQRKKATNDEKERTNKGLTLDVDEV